MPHLLTLIIFFVFAHILKIMYVTEAVKVCAFLFALYRNDAIMWVASIKTVRVQNISVGMENGAYSIQKYMYTYAHAQKYSIP